MNYNIEYNYCLYSHSNLINYLEYYERNKHLPIMGPCKTNFTIDELQQSIKIYTSGIILLPNIINFLKLCLRHVLLKTETGYVLKIEKNFKIPVLQVPEVYEFTAESIIKCYDKFFAEGLHIFQVQYHPGTIIYKGDYNINEQYQKSDIVIYNNKVYIADRDTKGVPPTSDMEDWSYVK